MSQAKGKPAPAGAAVEHLFPSTTWEYRKVKVRRPAGGQKASSPQAKRLFGLPPWPARKPLTVTVKFRGGPECWYELHARGAVVRYPGWLSLDDVMAEVMRRH